MIYDPKQGLLNFNGIELRTRPVLFQHKLWQNTEHFFKQTENSLVQRYNDSHGTDKTVLPISFVYALSKGGHRIQTGKLLETLGYHGSRFLPSEPDYKFLLNELFLRFTGSDPDTYIQSFRIPGTSSLEVINFVVLPYEDYFVGLVSVEG